MGEGSASERPGIGSALGRVPSGLYVLTARSGDRATGILASWVQQAGFHPPMLTVAVNRDRYIGDWIAASGRLALSQLATGSKALIRHFGRGFEPDTPAFEGLGLLQEAAGGPILEAAMAFLDAEVVGALAEGDHRLFLARIVGGRVLDSGLKPLLHVRANGFHY